MPPMPCSRRYSKFTAVAKFVFNSLNNRMQDVMGSTLDLKDSLIERYYCGVCDLSGRNFNVLITLRCMMVVATYSVPCFSCGILSLLY